MTRKALFSKKTIMILGSVILLYALVGFFLLPVLGKNVLKDKLSIALNRDVTIEKVAVNPFWLTANIEGLVVKDKSKEIFFSAQKMFVNLSLSSIFTFTPVVSDFSLENPYVNLIREKDNSFNFSDLLTAEKKSEPPLQKIDPQDREIFGFILKNVKIKQGDIHFEDKAKGASHLVKDFSLTLDFLSSKKKNRNEKSIINIDFILNQADVQIRIESTPFTDTLATQADIKTGDIDVIHYLTYLPIPENMVLKGLDLNLDVHADFQKNNSNNSLLLEGKLNAVNAEIKDALGEEIIKFPTLAVEISTSDILANQFNISKVLIMSPELVITRDKTGEVNLVKYFPYHKEDDQKTEDKKTADSTQKPYILNLADFQIKNAGIFFKDNFPEKEFQTRIFPLNVRVEKFTTQSHMSGEYSLDLETEIKETMDSKGRFEISPATADGTLSLSSLMLNKYAPYYEGLVGFDVKEGRVNLSLGYEILSKQEKSDIRIKTEEFLIQSLTIVDRQSKEEMINIPEFKIIESSFDAGSKTIDTGTITVKNGTLLVKRNKDGQINFVKSVLPQKESKKKADTAIETRSGQSEDPVVPWAVTMKSFDATGFKVRFNDLTHNDPIHVDLSDISIKANNLKTFGDENGNLDARMNWNKEGRINIKGDVTPSVLKAGLDIDLEKIDIKSLQPYFSDFVRILVTDGSINTKGRVKINLSDTLADQILFSGEISAINFISLDKQTAKDFFKCNSLYLSGLDVSVFPVKITAKDISLTDFYLRIIVSDKGEMNLNTVLKPEITGGKASGPVATQAGPASAVPMIRIENVTLQGGNLNFSDYFTRPNFTAGMKQIAGSVTSLSSDELSRANLHLQGIHGQSSPLVIIGTINPLAQKKFADIHISFKDIELANFTPYSSKYLGYKVEKGKLILDLQYNIDGNTLKSENRVRFDNFELGEKVTSENATSMPVGLAIALLKNREGQIDLDLPVKGDLNDPEFKIGSIIFKMIGNLILKVVTSPFSILGSMFGGGEELGFVEFQYGEIKIDETNYDKIDKLAQILQEKPSIKLEIQGGYDKLKDAEVLRMKGFEELIRTEKLKEKPASGKEAVLTEGEVERYIDNAYAKAEFPKPRDDAGAEKTLGIEEKKKLLITNISIDENDLRLLAMDRAENIKSYLLSTGKVEKQRIFLIEPIENKDSKTEQTSKVTFLLK